MRCLDICPVRLPYPLPFVSKVMVFIGIAANTQLFAAYYNDLPEECGKVCSEPNKEGSARKIG